MSTFFDVLQAERELPWLSLVYVAPADFDAIAGMRSVAIFGKSGAGKTALQLMMVQRAAEYGPRGPLIVHWRPEPAPADGSAAMQHALADAFRVCAFELLRSMGQRPDAYAAAPRWVQETLAWFIQQHLRGDPEFQASKLESSCSAEGIETMYRIVRATPRQILPPDTAFSAVIAELTQALHALNLAGIWLLVEGIEPWVEGEPRQIAQTLRALISALSIFENAGFVLKLIVPDSIEAPLLAAGGFSKRRIDPYRLTWTIDQLVQIVERRLTTFLRREVRLADLYDSPALTAWLARYGGDSPRTWLDLMRPLAELAAREQTIATTPDQWLAVSRRYMPPLRIDRDTRQVFIGAGQVSDLTPMMYQMLLYLYESYPRPCSRSELYYKVYRGFDFEPRSSADTHWVAPREWNGTIDNIIYRLRLAIEPDPADPLYIVTRRGVGVRIDRVE